jgi:hypothetical protein
MEPVKTNCRDAHTLAELGPAGLLTAVHPPTVGLSQVGVEGDEVAIFKSGNSKIDIYLSTYAGTNQATAVSWNVGNRSTRRLRIAGEGRAVRTLRSAEGGPSA